MPTPTEVCFEAMASEDGVVVKTATPSKYRQQLYAAIRKNPDFAPLGVYISPTNPNNELWVVKKDKADGKS